jgi:hypothetical protein
MLPRRPEASAQTDFRPRAMHTSPRGGERRFPLGSRLLTTAVSSYQPRTRSSKRAVCSKNTASVLADWKSPNKQSPHRLGDTQRGVSDPRMRRSPPSLRFATHTSEALRPLCILADHPFLFAPECLGIGHVVLLNGRHHPAAYPREIRGRQLSAHPPELSAPSAEARSKCLADS